MLKRNITYTDFNGNEVTETLYFNLTRTECIQLEIGYEGGLVATLERIIESKDVRQLITEFQNIVLAAYGVRSEDGKRFIKNDEVREEFKQTAAYDALFMELATDADTAAVFVNGIIPADLVQRDQDKPVVSTSPIPVPKTNPE